MRPLHILSDQYRSSSCSSTSRLSRTCTLLYATRLPLTSPQFPGFSNPQRRSPCTSCERTCICPEGPPREPLSFRCRARFNTAASLCIIVRLPVFAAAHPPQASLAFAIPAILRRVGSLCSSHAEPPISDSSSSEPSSSFLPEQPHEQEQHSDPEQYDPYNPYSYAEHNGHASDDGAQMVNSPTSRLDSYPSVPNLSISASA